jgi:hypothetical protein
VARILLSCEGLRARQNSLLSAECNGAVLDGASWALLAAPPRAFVARPAARVVNRALAAARPSEEGETGVGLYDVIQVSDGTVVTLYHWRHPSKGPVWCLATSNAYDVSPLLWMGSKPYAELVFELLALHPRFVAETGARLLRGFLCPGDVRLDFSCLDPSRCYTFGFRHPEFHPLAADPPAVWNIQAVDLATGRPSHASALAPIRGGRRRPAESGGLPHIPRQAAFSRADIVRLALAAGRGRGKSTGVKVGDFDLISRTALAEAQAAISGASVPGLLPAAPGVHVSPFNYGFILRARDPGACGGGDVLCESPLLRRVRQLVYLRPPRQIREKLDELSRLEYCALRAFLSVSDRADFLALFPAFAGRYAAYREFVENVIRQILLAYRQSSLGEAPAFGRPAAPRSRTKIIAQGLLAHILRHERAFDAFHADAPSIVHDYVVCPEYAFVYLQAMAPSPPRPRRAGEIGAAEEGSADASAEDGAGEGAGDPVKGPTGEGPAGEGPAGEGPAEEGPAEEGPVEAAAEDLADASAEDGAGGPAQGPAAEEEGPSEDLSEDSTGVPAKGPVPAEGPAGDPAEGPAEDAADGTFGGEAEDASEDRAEDAAEDRAEDAADGGGEDAAEGGGEDAAEGGAEEDPAEEGAIGGEARAE